MNRLRPCRHWTMCWNSTSVSWTLPRARARSFWRCTPTWQAHHEFPRSSGCNWLASQVAKFATLHKLADILPILYTTWYTNYELGLFPASWLWFLFVRLVLVCLLREVFNLCSLSFALPLRCNNVFQAERNPTARYQRFVPCPRICTRSWHPLSRCL